MMNRKLQLLLLLVLTHLSASVIAVDGDVVYSAPYIWVNPETGQIETKNPGPRLKTHEDVARPAAGANVLGQADESTMTAASSEGQNAVADHGETAAPHTSLVQPLIVIAGMIAAVAVIVVMGRSKSRA